MRQQGGMIRGASTAQLDAASVAGVIASHGNSVTLSSGETLDALVLVTEKDIQKYVTSDDGSPGGRGKVVIIFVFDGSVFGKVNAGDMLTYKGVRYGVQTPMYPRESNDVMIEFAVACFAP